MNTQSILKDIEHTILLLRSGEDFEARNFFNEHIQGTYKKIVSEREDLFQLKMFLQELDDYVNDPVVRIVNATTLDELTKSYIELVNDIESKRG